MSDSVNKPSHYNAGGVETIEGIKAALGDAFLDYCRGNVLKYVWRCKHKGKLLEDLRKAAKYLEWAIEAAESNCPVIPDSSRGKSLAIPHGWRELEPDEMPLATDMHEWMGGWFFRKDDATHEYKWHSSRHIRKIETLESKPLAIPEGWRELEIGEALSKNDLYCRDGKWNPYVESNPAGSDFPRYSKGIHYKHIRKIETANTSDSLTGKQGYFDDADGVWVDETNPFDGRKIETPKPEPLAIPEGWRELEADEMPKVTDLYENEGVWRNRINDSSIEYARYEARHIRKIETANPSEAPNSSIPDPGEGYRLLSKEPPEQVVRGDEFWQNFNSEWVESENFMHEGGPQAPELYYRRKIEAAEWIPKVGDKVWVNKPGRIAHGKVGVIVEANACEFAVRLDVENLTSFNLKAIHLELIEAAS